MGRRGKGEGRGGEGSEKGGKGIERPRIATLLG